MLRIVVSISVLVGLQIYQMPPAFAASSTITKQDRLEKEYQELISGKLKLTHTQRVSLIKEMIRECKPYMLKQDSTVMDLGLWGNIVVQTEKKTLNKYGAIGYPITDYPKGIYWLVKVSVLNMGSSSSTIDASMFSLVDSNGDRYSSDESAEMLLNGVNGFVMSNINPGLQYDGYIVFDMPKSVVPSHVRLVVNESKSLNLKIG